MCSRARLRFATALAVGILLSLFGLRRRLIGAASGYFGGRIDTIVQRIVDILLAFPIIVSPWYVIAVLGKKQLGGVDMNLIAAIALPIIPKMARIARSSTLFIAAMLYIDAAGGGCSHSRSSCATSC